MQIGKGSLNQLPEIIKTLEPIKSFLIVTDKQMVEFGYVKRLQDILSKAGLKSNIFDETVPDPNDTVVLNGINFLEKSGEKKLGHLNDYKEYQRKTPRLFWFI